MRHTALALLEVVAWVVYRAALVFHVFWFLSGYQAIFVASHDRLMWHPRSTNLSLGFAVALVLWLWGSRRQRGWLRGLISFGLTWVFVQTVLWLVSVGEPYGGLAKMHHHMALGVALLVAWWAGIPRPRAEDFLVKAEGIGTFLFLALFGLHSARILLFASWLLAGWLLLTFTAIPDPAAAGVALPTTLFLAGVMVVDRARRLKYPGRYVLEWEDVPRSGSPLTASQVGQQLTEILSSAGLRG